MDEEQIVKISKTTMLLITGCSFLLFNLAMRLLDGAPSSFLFYAGIGALGLGIMNGMITVIKAIYAIRKKRLSR